MAMDSAVWAILGRVMEERRRQDARWGEHDHPDVDRQLTDRGPSERSGMRSEGGCTPQRMAEEYGIPTESRARGNCQGAAEAGQCTWAHLLVEEVAELIGAATLAQQGRGPQDEVDEELVQVIAVGLAWMEARARRDAAPLPAGATRALTHGAPHPTGGQVTMGPTVPGPALLRLTAMLEAAAERRASWAPFETADVRAMLYLLDDVRGERDEARAAMTAVRQAYPEAFDGGAFVGREPAAVPTNGGDR